MSHIYLLLSLLCLVFAASAQSTNSDVVVGGYFLPNTVCVDIEDNSVQPLLPRTVELLMKAYPQTIVGYSDGLLITVDELTTIRYRNKIPQGIVDVFEKHGFIWGGKWMHYVQRTLNIVQSYCNI